MNSNTFGERIELGGENWPQKLGTTNQYSLFSLILGDSASLLIEKLGNSFEIRENLKKTYRVYYQQSRFGFQIVDSRISGFTIVNYDRISITDVSKIIGKPTDKNTIIG